MQKVARDEKWKHSFCREIGTEKINYEVTLKWILRSKVRCGMDLSDSGEKAVVLVETVMKPRVL
jgi:hypothetical protein